MGKLYAANRVVSAESTSTITNGVVEIENAVVKRVFKLEKEIAFTTWLGGTIYVKETEHGLQAFKDNNILI